MYTKLLRDSNPNKVGDTEMSNNESNSEFELLASATNFIKPEFDKASPQWASSPFEWVVKLPSASKGKLGKRLVYQ